ncbi:MAG TPA: DUF2207 domain-containing protein, partial [Negativicutes bacterium]|nr:DUF2207 domain-containing protein [Negativicutes bacterium]
MGRFTKILKVISLLFILAVSAISFSDFNFDFFNLQDKSYKELELRVDAKILPDGSMAVRETRILEFKGEFSRYRRQIPHQGFGNLVDIKVAEPNLPYSLVTTPTERAEGRFAISKATVSGIANDVIELFFQAKNQKRTFIIEYRFTDVVFVHSDVAEVYWKFIGAGRSLPIESMTVTLDLPPGASAEAVKAWGHGPSKGTVQRLSGSQLSWQTANLPKDKFLEGRVTFPLGLVPQAKKITNKVALPEILAQEQRWADQRAAEQRAALFNLVGSFAIGILGIIAALMIFFRFGRRYKSPLEVEYYRELPGSYSPAEAGCLLDNGKIKPQAIAATFMDLARQGYLRMEPAHNSESEDILVHQLKPAGEKLAPHERLLLEFFFNRVGGMQPAVWFSALKIFRKADPQATATFMKSFQLSVKEAVTAMGYFDSANRGKSIAGFGLVIGFAGLVICMMMEWFYLAAACTVVVLSMLIALISCRNLTPAGQQQFDLWLAFRRFLKDFSNLDRAQVPQLILWEHYLVYAVALGVAKEVIRQLPIVYPQVTDPDTHFGAYWGGMYHSNYDSNGALLQSSFSGFTTFDAFVDSMETTWNDAYSAVSSSGASSGGGSSG